MNKSADPIGENLKNKRKERGLSVPELADVIDIPADRIYKWESGKAAPKYEDRQFIEKWINSEDWKNVPRLTGNTERENYNERSLNNLTESNKILAEANKTLADANKTLAEANHVISKNHDELIQLTKMIVQANSRTSQATVTSETDSKVSTEEAEKELRQTGRTGPFSLQGKHEPTGKKDKTNK